jgi:hypothetical protein
MVRAGSTARRARSAPAAATAAAAPAAAPCAPHAATAGPAGAHAPLPAGALARRPDRPGSLLGVQAVHRLAAARKVGLVPALACIALPAVRTAAISAPEPLRLGSGAGGCCGWDDVDIDRNISINRARSFSASIRHWPAGKAPRTGVRDHLRDLAAFFFSSEKPFAAFRPSGLKSSISWTRRTSMISSSLMGARFAHSIASSRDFTWIIQ